MERDSESGSGNWDVRRGSVLAVLGMAIVVLGVFEVIAISIGAASIYVVALLAIVIVAGLRADRYLEASRHALEGLAWFTLPSGTLAGLVVVTRYPEYYDSPGVAVADLLLGWFIIGVAGAVLAWATHGIARVVSMSQSAS